MLPRHPVFDELEVALAAVVPREPVELAGRWVPSVRRTYETARQKGTGTGPFREVVDVRWRGALTGPGPVAGIAFMLTATELFWGKSLPPASTLPVDVSLHAYADYSVEQATFAAGVGGIVLPAVRVVCGPDLAASCTVGPLRVATGRIEQLAEADTVTFSVFLIPGRLLKVGRRRLWHLREELALSLPPRILDILTRRRIGRIPWESPAT